MKTSFKSEEIAHIWVHKSAPRGTCPGAMSFNGPAFLSYGTEIARHFTFKGKDAVLLNESRYRTTTSKHQNIVGAAIAGLQIFRIGNCGRGDCLAKITGKYIFEYAVARAAAFQKKAETATKRRAAFLGESAGWLESAKAANEFFDLRRKVDEQAIAKFRVATATAERKEKARREAVDAKHKVEQQKAFDIWLSGGQSRGFSPNLFPIAFRVEGKDLVSTLGARVPLREAKIAFRFALARRAAGWHRNGETCTVGHYQLDAVNANGVVAGCHRIAWDEIERLSSVLA